MTEIQRKTLNQLIKEAMDQGSAHEHYREGMINVRMRNSHVKGGRPFPVFYLNGSRNISKTRAHAIEQAHFLAELPVNAITITEKVKTMQQVTFFFHPDRESDYDASIKLIGKHFPGAFRLGFNTSVLYRRGIMITCTGEQFVDWMVERCNMGFVNRMKQLNITVKYVSPQATITAKAPQEYVAKPVEYVTPEAGWPR